ncbi:hypothetical protein LCGC14_1943930 [marine sediment metagenome]|uniref:Uncharacterized protein n=1 Tax=marine sediment metagenome TaxID=412755 RepID=A0A0F9IGL3_9ZZZZ
MSKEIIYAIRAMTWKDGKTPRKKKVWVSWNIHLGKWWINDGSPLAYHIAWQRPTEAIRAMSNGGDDLEKEMIKYHTRMCEEAEAALGCKCAVVAIELKEVECE